MPVRLKSGSADTSRRPSDALWGQIRHAEIKAGTIGGSWDEDDFNRGGLITAVTTDASLIGISYYGFNDSGGTHTFTDVQGGVLAVTEATDNEGSFVRRSSWPFQISSLLGKLCFEARVKVNAITDNQIGWIMGLWDNVACSNIVPLSTAGPPIMATTGNFVGFWSPEEDAGGVNTIYKADGIATGAIQTLVHQFVADTYVKLGMVFDPNYRNTGVASLAFYVNGVEQGSRVTVPNATGTTFPADVRMNFMMGHRLGASTSSISSCDWWKCCQEDTQALQGLQ